jgi:hypothetical protein
MAPILVSMICIVMIVAGGMTLSQGILTSTDTTALSVEEISVREGEVTRTGIEAVRAEPLAWADLLRVTVANTGQTRLASFEKWDFIAQYSGADGLYHTEWLPYTTGDLTGNRWRKARIGLNGPVEFFEPGIVNPGEELVMLARLNPLPGDNTTGEITVATPNGIYQSITFDNPGLAVLVPHAENITLAGTRYYEMAEATAADSPGYSFAASFEQDTGSRKLLMNEDQPTRPARYIFPLVGIDQIPAATWTFYYTGYVWGDGEFPRGDNDVCFNADILVRKADGTLRTTIATIVASAYVAKSETEGWVTKSGTYAFPGYTVVDENDYLEIDYYGQTGQGPDGGSGTMELRVDDDNLPLDEQTRIEA